MILASRVERSVQERGGRQPQVQRGLSFLRACLFVCLAHNYGCIRLCMRMECVFVLGEML